MPELIGREGEKELLEEKLASSNSEMIAILGRRRVGKTFLIKKVFAKMDFEFTGMLNASLNDQLENFSNKLFEFGYRKKNVEKPTTWLQAFNQLKALLQAKKTAKKKIIFIDELPWADTPRSNFVEALGLFWNDFAVHNNIILIICGSAASWMIKKVVHTKGGLHNRITALITLQPFTLHETEKYLKVKNIVFNRYQIAQLYMSIGGIPYYLNEVKKGESVAQNIDRICFRKNGLLTDEFNKLFTSLFHDPENHFTIVKALASKWKGLTRKEILSITKLTDGGNITKVIDELEASAFISATQPFGKTKKETLYRLADFYCIFYLHFITAQNKAAANTFINISKSSKYMSWIGYAFENLCISHVQKIIDALKLTAIYTETSGYVLKGKTDQQGTQIDLLIDRADNIINLCEMKFYDAPFTITKEYAAKLRLKMATFRSATGTRKVLFTTMITTYGLVNNIHSAELIQNQVTLDSLFAK
jgi:hypothetical protein